MADEQLQQIRERTEAASPGPWAQPAYPSGTMVYRLVDHSLAGLIATCERATDTDFIAHTREDIPALLAEVDRLRAREATAMAIVQAVKDRGVYFTLQNGRHCYFCEAETETYTGEPPHKADCPVAKARALLAQE